MLRPVRCPSSYVLGLGDALEDRQKASCLFVILLNRIEQMVSIKEIPQNLHGLMERMYLKFQVGDSGKS